MQVTETTAEGLKRQYRVVVPADDLEGRMQNRLAELGRSVAVPGFRPGKVPLPLLRKRYGEAVRGEVLEKAIEESMRQTITDNGLRPALEPKIDLVSAESGRDLEFTIALEVLPDIAPLDYAAITLERPVIEVGDDKIDEALARLAESRRSFSPAPEDHAAETGDQLTIDFVGRIDGEAFEGGAAEGFQLELGAGRFLPEFETGLAGVKAGETREIAVTFPEDYPAETVKGKQAIFEAKVNEIRRPQSAAVDEELAKTMGLESLEALRRAAREQIEREYAQVTRGRIKRKLLDRLAEQAAFDVPAGMVEREFESIWQQIEQAKERDQLDEDDKGLSEDELKERYRAIALRRVRLGLMLSDVGVKNNLTVSQDDVNRALTEQARRFPGQEQQVFEFYQRNPQALQELQAPIFEDKVINFLLEMADVTDRKVSEEEFKALEEADAKSAASGAAAP